MMPRWRRVHTVGSELSIHRTPTPIAREARAVHPPGMGPESSWSPVCQDIPQAAASTPERLRSTSGRSPPDFPRRISRALVEGLLDIVQCQAVAVGQSVGDNRARRRVHEHVGAVIVGSRVSPTRFLQYETLSCCCSACPVLSDFVVRIRGHAGSLTGTDAGNNAGSNAELGSAGFFGGTQGLPPLP